MTERCKPCARVQMTEPFNLDRVERQTKLYGLLPPERRAEIDKLCDCNPHIGARSINHRIGCARSEAIMNLPDSEREP